VADTADWAAAAGAGLESALAIANAWRERSFPLTGADVLDLGFTAGPQIGALLRAVEDWWIAEDFAPDRAGCLARLRELAASA
jgi:poly(A) polymerase